MPTVLITGANRGLGLEFARQYAAEGWRVIATARSPDGAVALHELAAATGERVQVYGLDVADFAAIEALAATLSGVPIDVLINNAGSMGAARTSAAGAAAQRFGKSNYADWIDTFCINALAPMKMAEAFVEHIAASDEKKVVTLSSTLGSIGNNTLGGFYAYRSTKAAVNAVMKSLALDLARRGIIAVPVHPGWVRTDMGGASATLVPADSIAGLRRLIARLTAVDSGRFWNWDGTEMPW